MSTETLEQEVKVKEPAEPLLSKRRKKFITDPLNEDNPITIQVLGICFCSGGNCKDGANIGDVDLSGFCNCIL